MPSAITNTTSPLDRAIRCFKRQFGSTPTLAAAAPGRVNLIGEHTDYNDGFVLPMAIDRACVCVAGLSSNPTQSVIASADLESPVSIDWKRVMARPDEALAALPKGSEWARYAIGVVELARRRAAAPGPGAPSALPSLNMVIASDVPLGSGLSSSASMSMAVACVIEKNAGLSLSPLVRAKLCQQVEHEFAGVPCGLMDPYASAFGKAGHAMLVDCRSPSHTYVPMPPTDETGAVVVVVNSNVRHELASGEYAKRREACIRASKLLGVRSLREVEPMRSDHRDLILSLPSDLEGIVHHVVFDNARAEHFARLATEAAAGEVTWKRALPPLGEMMNRSHASLRVDYKVSCAELDTLVELACSVRGVYGARMTGGGFGGCIIALVRPQAVGTLIETLNAEYPRRHQRECTCFVVKAAAGAGMVPLR